jgi:hypothetical protein
MQKRNADKEDLLEKNKNKKCSKVRWLAQANALKKPKDYGIMKGK